MKCFILPKNITTYIINNVTCLQFQNNEKKLEWQRFINKERFNWEESKTFENQLKLNGSNWKLPKSNELKGLVNKNYNYYEHFYNRKCWNFICFGKGTICYFWSTSPVVDSKCHNYMYGICFNDGKIGYLFKSNKHYNKYGVRCVR